MDADKRRWIVTGMGRDDGRSQTVIIMARSADQALRAAQKLGIESARATPEGGEIAEASAAPGPAPRVINRTLAVRLADGARRVWRDKDTRVGLILTAIIGPLLLVAIIASVGEPDEPAQPEMRPERKRAIARAQSDAFERERRVRNVQWICDIEHVGEPVLLQQPIGGEKGLRLIELTLAPPTYDGTSRIRWRAKVKFSDTDHAFIIASPVFLDAAGRLVVASTPALYAVPPGEHEITGEPKVSSDESRQIARLAVMFSNPTREIVDSAIAGRLRRQNR
jgi:hypothetical protein